MLPKCVLFTPNKLKKSLFTCLFLISSTAIALNPYSNSELDTLEKEFIEHINQSNQVIRTPLAVDYVNQLGQRLNQNTISPTPTFFIVNSQEINAFAGPGGHIGINTALILASDTEDELAAVMAHELAHVKLHHLYDMIEHQKLMRYPTLASMLAAIALGVINPVLGSGAMMASLSGAAQDSINYTRIHEKEADRIGMQLLVNAHFQPRAMAAFFKKLQNNSRYYDRSNIPAILQTHPLDDERIAEAENRTQNLKPSDTTCRDDHSDGLALTKNDEMRSSPEVPPSIHADGKRIFNTPTHVFRKSYGGCNHSIDFQLVKALLQSQTAVSLKALFDGYAHQPRTIGNEYGMTLALISSNRFESAQNRLAPLLEQDPDNPFFVLAQAQIDLGLRHTTEAITRLKNFYASHPNHYPTLVALGETLLEANEANDAAMLLTKAFRRYPQDLTVCKILAKAEAANKRPSYAYFVESNCEYLQGHDKQALLRLKTALSLVKRDPYLKARIEAKIEEIKQLRSG